MNYNCNEIFLFFVFVCLFVCLLVCCFFCVCRRSMLLLSNYFTPSSFQNNDTMRELEVIVMLFNPTFNNISVISLRSVLLVEEAEKNDGPAVSH